MTAVKFEKLGEHVGAEVLGIDADDLLHDDSLAAAISTALEDSGVLIFRQLHLEPEIQVEFCRKIGEVEVFPNQDAPPGIFRVTLDKSKNPAAAYLRGTFEWHIDGCTPAGDELPQMATVLSAVAVAEGGGETEFASTYGAYQTLSAEEKERYNSMRVIHTLEASQRMVTPDPSPKQLAAWRRREPKENPLVWTHRSGRRSLVLGASTDHVVGLDREAGRLLLDQLLERSTVPERVYRHHWSVGDTVMWDNRGVLHRVEPYDMASDREMLRTTLLGDEPIE